MRAKSIATTFSERTPWRLGSARKLGMSMMVSSGAKSLSADASGRINSVRMNSECQASSVKTRVLIWKLGSAPP